LPFFQFLSCFALVNCWCCWLLPLFSHESNKYFRLWHAIDYFLLFLMY
jgi:hypothetical protein